jgi:hypothetical protein
MQTKTDLKAGLTGSCQMMVNRFGQCEKIMCPYPPFKFACYRADLLTPSPPSSPIPIPYPNIQNIQLRS